MGAGTLEVHVVHLVHFVPNYKDGVDAVDDMDLMLTRYCGFLGVKPQALATRSR